MIIWFFSWNDTIIIIEAKLSFVIVLQTKNIDECPLLTYLPYIPIHQIYISALTYILIALSVFMGVIAGTDRLNSETLFNYAGKY